MQSQELTNFYKAYVSWIDEGAPDQLPFWRRFGLCSSLIDFNDKIADKLHKEMVKQFVDSGLSSIYPFGNYLRFSSDTLKETQHLNTKREEWARNHAKG